MATISIKEIMSKVSALVTDPASRKRILDKASAELAAMVAIYPAEGIWNRFPGTRGDGRWYERGYGSRWMTKKGIGGSNTSEKFNKSWQATQQDEFTASVHTAVTYAPYLLDPAQRVSWAAEHGWKSLDEIGEEFAPIFEATALEEIDKQIEKI